MAEQLGVSFASMCFVKKPNACFQRRATVARNMSKRRQALVLKEINQPLFR